MPENEDLEFLGEPTSSGERKDSSLDSGATYIATIEEDVATQENRRSQKVKNTIYDVLIIGFIISAIVLFALFALRAWHLVATKDTSWMTEKQLTFIDELIKIAFSGSIGGLLFKFAEGHLSSKQRPRR